MCGIDLMSILYVTPPHCVKIVPILDLNLTFFNHVNYIRECKSLTIIIFANKTC